MSVVYINSAEYPSEYDAASALQIREETLIKLLSEKKPVTFHGKLIRTKEMIEQIEQPKEIKQIKLVKKVRRARCTPYGVKCLETNEVYKSQAALAKVLDVDPATLSRTLIINGKFKKFNYTYVPNEQPITSKHKLKNTRKITSKVSKPTNSKDILEKTAINLIENKDISTAIKLLTLLNDL